MRNAIIALALAATSVAALAQTPAPAPAPAPTPAPAPVSTTSAETAPSPDTIARRAIDVLAGPAWEKARYFSFTFNVLRNGQRVVSFPQRWDRYTGDYRVSGRDQKGSQFEVIMNVNTKKGKGWRDGVEATDPTELLELGYRRFINDTYWLLMPLKSMDPGVHREYAGERTDSCGKTWDLVKLSFDPGVGITSKDQYWMWVNRDSGVVDEWDMKLEGSKPDDSPVTVYFHNYNRYNGLLISTQREVRGRGQTIGLDDLVVSSETPKGVFEK